MYDISSEEHILTENYEPQSESDSHVAFSFQDVTNAPTVLISHGVHSQNCLFLGQKMQLNPDFFDVCMYTRVWRTHTFNTGSNS